MFDSNDIRCLVPIFYILSQKRFLSFLVKPVQFWDSQMPENINITKYSAAENQEHQLLISVYFLTSLDIFQSIFIFQAKFKKSDNFHILTEITFYHICEMDFAGNMIPVVLLKNDLLNGLLAICFDIFEKS